MAKGTSTHSLQDVTSISSTDELWSRRMIAATCNRVLLRNGLQGPGHTLVLLMEKVCGLNQKGAHRRHSATYTAGSTGK